MKNPILPMAILLALGTLAQAADPADAHFEQIFQVMYDLPKSPKDTQLERLKALIDQGADVNAAIGFDRMLRVGETRADLRGVTWPLDVAVQQARVDMVKILLAKGATFHGGELAQAALAGNEDESVVMITALLQAGADVNSRRLFQGGCAAPDYGFTALLWASYKGNKNAVKLLLAQPGIKLDETNDDGDTALMAAAEHGHAEIVEMLLAAGANVNITDIGGETAIARAQKGLAKQQAIVEKQQAIIFKLQSRPK
jgi:ankyrin repeat protein